MAAGLVERIAHFRILKRIGRGGMGIVYQAVDERDDRIVALKVIREAEAPGDESSAHLREARVRFDREAAILKSLLHVNVVSFLEIGEEDGTPSYLIADGSELDPKWVRGVKAVGLTAGASAPERLVEDVIEALGRIEPVEVTQMDGKKEHIEFRLPAELRNDRAPAA